jgi:hypothetical protein
LCRTRSDAVALKDRLERCIEDFDDAYFALSVTKQPTEKRRSSAPTQLCNDRRLAHLVAELYHLANWAADAKSVVVERKPGPDTGNIYLLVARLDAICEHFTGRKMTRSSNITAEGVNSRDYAAICEIVDASIGSGTIEAAMKAHITRRGRNGS